LGELEAVQRLRNFHLQAGDAEKLVSCMKKEIELATALGKGELVKNVKMEFLPNSKCYSLISGQDIPSPVSIWRDLCFDLESKLQNYIVEQVKTRKSRLGAGPIEKVTSQVEEEIYSITDLENVYQELLRLDLSDVERKNFKFSAIDFCWKKMLYVDPTAKSKLLSSVEGYIMNVLNEVFIARKFVYSNVNSKISCSRIMILIPLQIFKMSLKIFESLLNLLERLKWA
jgi:hypothetical protein